MPSQYLGILVLIILAGIICGVMIAGSWLLGPKKNTPYKSSPYECGVTPEGNARERFPIQFYLVAIMFILFDIEVVFLWSWMTIFKSSSSAFKQFSFMEVVLYMVTWVVGYLYMIRVGAMTWDEGTVFSKKEDEAVELAFHEGEPLAALDEQELAGAH